MHATRPSSPIALLVLACSLAWCAPTHAGGLNPVFSTQWGTQGTGPGQFNGPTYLAHAQTGHVYVMDSQSSRLQKFTDTGEYVMEWGHFENDTGSYDLYAGAGVTIGVDGSVYVADYHYVRRYTPDGQFIARWGRPGGDPFNGVGELATAPDGDILLVGRGDDHVYRFSSNGAFVTSWGGTGSSNGLFRLPNGIAVDQDGAVYVAEEAGHRVQKFSGDGQFLLSWGGGPNGVLGTAEGVAVEPGGNVLVTDLRSRVLCFTNSGVLLNIWGSVGSEPGQFNLPIGIDVDSAGNIYVADARNYRVQKFAPGDPTSTQTTTWGRLKAIYR